jgi:solute carrier family 25 S-adenosylmethionine transporter 26
MAGFRDAWALLLLAFTSGLKPTPRTPVQPATTRRNVLQHLGVAFLAAPAAALAAPVVVEAPPTPAVPRTNATATRAANATRPANATAPRPANATATRPANATATRPANATATRAANATATRPATNATAARAANATKPKPAAKTEKKKKKKPQLAKANVTEALSKNNMVVKRQESLLTEFVVDPKTGDELRELRLPPWWPRSLRPPREFYRKVPNAELALSACVAGGLTEVARAAVLHPVLTLKNRVQAGKSTDPRQLKNLYAGVGPALAASVPYAVTYYGAREITRRLTGVPLVPTDLTQFIATVGVAETAAIAVRAPADVLATRAQVSQPDTSILPWFRKESIEGLEFGIQRAPAQIASEVPYVLLRVGTIALLNNIAPLDGGVDALTARTVGVAIVAALATTPLDVARTRVLAGDQPGGIREVVDTVGQISRKEGPSALFQGAEYRVLYNGVVVAAFLPLRALFYTGLRDLLILDGVFEFDGLGPLGHVSKVVGEIVA